jgi:hypothetical protein
MKEPFRSRPRVTRPEATPPKSQPATPPEEEIIEGVIEEERSVVPFDPVVSHQEQARAQYYEYLAREEETQPRTGFWSKVDAPGLFLVALALVVGGIFFTLLNVAELPAIVTNWWPIVTLVISFAWSFSALKQRNAAAFLGGAGAVGLSISMLLHTQEIADFGETFVGFVLISIGTGVIMRGLLLRQATA